jgi:PAS domain-containing protein
MSLPGVRAMRENRRVENVEMGIVKDKGEITWLSATAAPISLEDFGVVIVYSDITGRKRDEDDLRDSRHFFHDTINSLKRHICVLDETGTIVLTNQAWDDFALANTGDLRCVSEGVNYLADCDSVAGPDLESARRCSRGIRAVLSGESQEFSMEYPCHSPTERRWFTGNVSPLQRKGSRWVVINHDTITERKQAEEKLQKLNAELEKRVSERTADLSAKATELERVNKVFVGRELRMRELKEQIDELEKRLKHD